MVKSQVLVDFVAKFTGAPGPAPEDPEKAVDMPAKEDRNAPDQSIERWKLFIDGPSNSGGSRARLVLVCPDQYKTSQVLRFNFKPSNIETEYEAVIAGLRLAWELGVEDIEVFSDLMLIVNQVTREFPMKEE